MQAGGVEKNDGGLGAWRSGDQQSARTGYTFKTTSLPPAASQTYPLRPRTTPNSRRASRYKPKQNTQNMGQFGMIVRPVSRTGPSEKEESPQPSFSTQSPVLTPFLAKLLNRQKEHLSQKVAEVTKTLSEEKEPSYGQRNKVDLQPIHVELLKALAQNKHYWDALQVREEEIRALQTKLIESQAELGRANQFLGELRTQALETADRGQELREIKLEHSRLKGHHLSQREEERRLKEDLKAVTRSRDQSSAMTTSLRKSVHEQQLLAQELGKRLESTLKDKSDQQKEFEKELEQVRGEYFKLREDYRALALSHADCEDHKATVELKIAEDTEKMSHLIVDLAGLQHEHKGCDLRIDDLRNKLENLEDEHFGCFKRNQRNEAQVNGLTQAHMDCPTTIASMGKELEQLREDHQHCFTNLRSAKKELGRTRIQLREAIDGLEETAAKKKVWKDRVKELEAEHAAKDAKFEQADTDNDMAHLLQLRKSAETEATFWRRKHDDLQVVWGFENENG